MSSLSKRRRILKEDEDTDDEEVKLKHHSSFVGRPVRKTFYDFGEFSGRVKTSQNGLFMVEYDDGDSEELELFELLPILLDEKATISEGPGGRDSSVTLNSVREGDHVCIHFDGAWYSGEIYRKSQTGLWARFDCDESKIFVPAGDVPSIISERTQTLERDYSPTTANVLVNQWCYTREETCESDFQRDVVCPPERIAWAKVSSVPWWPAKLGLTPLREQLRRRPSVSDPLVFVVFFCSRSSFAWVSPGSVTPFTASSPDHSRKLRKKKLKGFKDALKSAESMAKGRPVPEGMRRDECKSSTVAVSLSSSPSLSVSPSNFACSLEHADDFPAPEDRRVEGVGEENPLLSPSCASTVCNPRDGTQLLSGDNQLDDESRGALAPKEIGGEDHTSTLCLPPHQQPLNLRSSATMFDATVECRFCAHESKNFRRKRKHERRNHPKEFAANERPDTAHYIPPEPSFLFCPICSLFVEAELSIHETSPYHKHMQSQQDALSVTTTLDVKAIETPDATTAEEEEGVFRESNQLSSSCETSGGCCPRDRAQGMRGDNQLDSSTSTDLESMLNPRSDVSWSPNSSSSSSSPSSFSFSSSSSSSSSFSSSSSSSSESSSSNGTFDFSTTPALSAGEATSSLSSTLPVSSSSSSSPSFSSSSSSSSTSSSLSSASSPPDERRAGALEVALRQVTQERDAAVEELRRARREGDAARARSEFLDDLVSPLEEMRHEMKSLLLNVRDSLLEAGIPSKFKADEQVPFWYSSCSWSQQACVPWLSSEKRALTPAEGVDWLARELAETRAKLDAEKKRTREASFPRDS